MTARIAEVPLVGGHRALDLVNTVVPRLPAGQREDYLAEPADLLTWSQRSGLLDAAAAEEVQAAWTASPAAGLRALTAVREIRESLYGVLSAYLGGTDGSAAAQEQRDHLSTAWAAAQPRARLLPAAEAVTSPAGYSARRPPCWSPIASPRTRLSSCPG